MFSGSSDTSTVAKYLMLAVCIMLFFPMIINIYAGVGMADEVDETQDKLLADYKGIVNASATQEQAWVLTGIYTPYGTNASGYASSSYLVLDDGWIAGDRVTSYAPTQFGGNALGGHESVRVAYDPETKMYYYTDAASGGYSAGDLYTRVNMDQSKMSSIFFSSAGKVESGDNFYYQFNGYRYCFQPTSNYDGKNAAGETVPVVANTSSLSLVWYYYLSTSGIAGQLVLSGSDSGVSYLTANEIVKGFNSNNYTSKFNMEFNGVDMNVYILLNPYAISQGYTVEECYNAGYWSILITSLAADPDAYNQTDYSFNIYEIWETIIMLFTFDADSLFSGDETAARIASIIFCGSFYVILVAIGLNHKEVLILAGIIALINGVLAFFDPLMDLIDTFIDNISNWFDGWDLGWDWWN